LLLSISSSSIRSSHLLFPTDVNPAGPLGVPDPAASAIDIRNSFGNMGFNDVESVSLIGGGHAFGKCHGACTDPVNGVCGDGVGTDGNQLTKTGDFEGPWTSTPAKWSNEYFNNLLNFEWNLTESPAGGPQWTPFNSDGSPGPSILMLTSDLAFTKDASYSELVNLYAANITALEKDFGASWYRLVSQDMGPASRCIGDFVLDPQPFQQPLPDAPDSKPDYIPLRESVQAKLDDESITADELVHLAFQCASTHRSTDYSGGCNGARIRFSPEIDWEVNAGIDAVLTKLGSIERGDASMSDLIVLAGNVGLEMAGGDGMTFCGGRVDAADAAFSENLEPRDYVSSATVGVRDDFEVMGLTAKQGVALYGRPSSRYPELGSIFTALTTETFEEKDGMFAPAAGGGGNSVTAKEYALVEDTEYKAIVEAFVADMAAFKTELAGGWTYLMTADRFSGPRENTCAGVDDATLATPPSGAHSSTAFAALVGTALAGFSGLFVV
jgi:catalase-peroxidase